jgi:multidrug efflux pump
MAYAIMGGPVLAILLTLVFLPAPYVAWFRIKAPQPAPREKMDQPQTAMAQPLTLSGAPGPL